MTRYVIKFVKTGAYLKNHPSYHHMTFDIDKAMRFVTMTEANIVAIMYGNYAASQYEIELIQQEPAIANA